MSPIFGVLHCRLRKCARPTALLFILAHHPLDAGDLDIRHFRNYPTNVVLVQKTKNGEKDIEGGGNRRKT